MAPAFCRAFAQRFPQRHAFGTNAQTVRGVFHVAAGVDVAVTCGDRGANLESGKRRDRPLPGLSGFRDEFRIHVYRKTVAGVCRRPRSSAP